MTSIAQTDDGVGIEYDVVGTGPLTLFSLHGWGNEAGFWHHSSMNTWT